MAKVISFQRVSTGSQDMARQQMLAEQYCAKNGHTLARTICEQVSGAKSNRKSIDELLSLTSSDCDLVVVSELSRVTREDEYEQIIYYISTIKRNGIDIVFLDDPNVVYKAGEKFTLVQLITLIVKAQGASEERQKIRDRMHSGRVAKLMQHPYMLAGSQVPFGYEAYANPDYVLGKTPKTLIRPNAREVTAIKQAFDMAVAGNSCQRIADWLNSSGYFHKNNKGEKKWYAEEVSRMLRNRLYIGERVILGVTNYVEPIVSVSAFEQADKTIRGNRKIVAKTKHFNPLKGLLFCGECGLPMAVATSVTGEETLRCLYRTYVGRNPNKTLSPCQNGRVYLGKLMDVLIATTVQRLQSSDYHAKTETTIFDLEMQLFEKNSRIPGIAAERGKISQKMRAIEGNIQQISEPTLVEMLEAAYTELKGQLEEVNGRSATLLSEMHELEARIDTLKCEISIPPMHTDAQKSEFLRLYIERIEWTSEQFKRRGTLKITYKNGDELTLADITNK